MSARLCSTHIIVIPKSLLSSRTVSMNFFLASGSSCAVGSSSNKTSGLITIMEARLRSCFCPPDNSSVFLSYQPVIPKYSDISATLRLMSALGTPRFSSPNASSCHTLSVTIWLSGFCPTYPILTAASA